MPIAWHSLQSNAYLLKLSANLHSHHLRCSGGQWLQETKSVERFLNLTLALIHPELHVCGMEILNKLQCYTTNTKITSEWESTYTGIQVISNQVTPGHWDSKGCPEWYDLLVRIGKGSLSTLLVNAISLELAYHPGTVVGLCRTILEHEVHAWGQGDWVCYAHFMWEAVRQQLRVNPVGWVMQNTYGKYLPRTITWTYKAAYPQYAPSLVVHIWHVALCCYLLHMARDEPDSANEGG